MKYFRLIHNKVIKLKKVLRMSKVYRIYKNKRYEVNVKKFKKCGYNFGGSFTTSNFSFSTISIGNNVFVGSGAWFFADLIIGNNVMFGPHCRVIGGDHIFGVLGKSNRYLKPVNNSNSQPIIIEDEVWCGANVIVLKGVKIGMGCIVGAGSVITKELPPFTINVGHPCKTIKRIFTDAELEKHLQILGYTNDIISEVIERRNRILRKTTNLPYHTNNKEYLYVE